jgi:hypothetical protein
MKRKHLIAFVLAAALVAVPVIASAAFVPGGGGSSGNSSGGGGGHGISGAGTYFLGSTFCAAGFLWLRAYATSQTQHRELTRGEAWETVGACYIPLIGGPIFRNYIESFPNP